MNNMESAIKEILEIAKNAPSGDNSQPWRFNLNGNILKIYNDKSKTNPIFDSKQYGAYIGHGCLLKNISEVAKNKRLLVEINYFPNKEDLRLVAELSFTKSENILENFGEFVPKRSTNRNLYLNKALSNEERTFLQNENLILVDGENKPLLAEYLSLGEKIVFETKELQDIIFKSLVFDPKQEAVKKEGLYAKTLELNPVQELLLKLAKNRAFLSFLNKSIGFSKLISKSNAETYKASSALGFIVGERTPENFLHVGELLEETWLKALSLGMGLQIINGFVFMSSDIDFVKEKTSLSLENESLLRNGLETMRETLKIEDGKSILAAFRIGYPKKASSKKSSKHSLDELRQKES